jgi:hypothetical protein
VEGLLQQSSEVGNPNFCKLIEYVYVSSVIRFCTGKVKNVRQHTIKDISSSNGADLYLKAICPVCLSDGRALLTRL